MKSLITIIIVFVFITSSEGYSEELKKGDIIKLNTKVKVISNLNSIDGTTKDIPQYLGEYLYKINNIGGETIELTALRFSLNETQIEIKGISKSGTPQKLSDLYNDRIFTVKKSDLLGSYSTNNPIERVSIGVLSLPFKFRTQSQFSYEDKFNINSTINFHLFSYGNSRFGVQLGTGIGSVEINKENAFGEFDSTLTSLPSLSLLSGIMYNYKFIQCGFYVGFDFINDQNKVNWMHNGNMWFGLGIGFKIFSISAYSDEENN